MDQISIRQLRNEGGQVIARVLSGEHLTVTRDGEPVAELRPIGRRPLKSAALLTQWSKLGTVDYKKMRSEIDELMDSGL